MVLAHVELVEAAAEEKVEVWRVGEGRMCCVCTVVYVLTHSLCELCLCNQLVPRVPKPRSCARILDLEKDGHDLEECFALHRCPGMVMLWTPVSLFYFPDMVNISFFLDHKLLDHII